MKGGGVRIEGREVKGKGERGTRDGIAGENGCDVIGGSEKREGREGREKEQRE